jgi:hypothetical protein
LVLFADAPTLNDATKTKIKMSEMMRFFMLRLPENVKYCRKRSKKIIAPVRENGQHNMGQCDKV